MHLNLKTEIEEMVQTLKDSKKINLAKQIEENWNKPCFKYSKNINAYKAKKPIEDIMQKALWLEFGRLGHTDKQIQKIIKYLKVHRVLQTVPHISPAQKPRYFFANWLASLPLSKNQFYPVAMFSGVPFSNRTRPGRLCSQNGDINLMPSNMQDELVYQSAIPGKMVETIKNLPAKIKKLLAGGVVGESYTKWALKSCQNMEKKYLRGKPIFFDFNEVTANYILLAIKDKNHPIYKILFTGNDRRKIISLFSNEIFFYNTARKGKYGTLEVFSLKDGYLESSTRKIKLEPKILAEEMKNNRLCPGLPLGFLAFTFLNYFKCFGSFAQTEYLPMYQKDFMKIPCLKKYRIKEAPILNLTTTGGFPENPQLHPLDLHLNEKLKINKNMLWGEVILTIKDVLLHQNYSTNMIK